MDFYTSSPRVWCTYEAEKNGKKYKIRIQTLTADLMEPVIEHMTEYFLAREPLTSHIDLQSDPVARKGFQELWRMTIKGGASLVAILEEGNDPPPHAIVGANVTGVSRKSGDPSPTVENERFMTVMKVVKAITIEADLFKKFGVDEYLTAYGLSVHPDFHGLGVGLKLLEMREPLCRSIGIKMTATVFTAAVSQHLAKKAGFDVVTEVLYKDYKIDGIVYYPNLEGILNVMAKVYD